MTSKQRTQAIVDKYLEVNGVVNITEECNPATSSLVKIGKTFKEIGDRFHITGERASQILTRALKKIRNKEDIMIRLKDYAGIGERPKEASISVTFRRGKRPHLFEYENDI